MGRWPQAVGWGVMAKVDRWAWFLPACGASCAFFLGSPPLCLPISSSLPLSSLSLLCPPLALKVTPHPGGGGGIAAAAWGHVTSHPCRMHRVWESSGSPVWGAEPTFPSPRPLWPPCPVSSASHVSFAPGLQVQARPVGLFPIQTQHCAFFRAEALKVMSWGGRGPRAWRGPLAAPLGVLLPRTPQPMSAGAKGSHHVRGEVHTRPPSL